MRIVGGSLRGRRLAAPEGRTIRPTADRTREALFNILEGGRFGPPDLLQGARVLDAFAGTGALGLEALSRGAASAVFLDSSPSALALCRENIKALGLADHAEVVTASAINPPKARTAADIILMDPPYGEDLAASATTALERQGWLAATGLVVAELAAKESFDPPEGFELLERRRYGKAALLFLRRKGD